MKKKEEKIEKYFSNITDDHLVSDVEKANYSFYKHVDPKNDGLSLATPKETCISEEGEYLRFFHDVVLTGIACGLDHPIEWIINAHRAPGGSLTQECYQEVEKHTPRFLVEVFENLFMRRPNNATEVLEMCDNHYPEGHLCRGYFNFLKADIERYLGGNSRL